MTDSPETTATQHIEKYLDIDWSSPVGQGAYGSVYRATNVKSSEKVIAKVIPYSGTAQPMPTKYLFREISTWRRIRHPNICQLRHVYFYMPVAPPDSKDPPKSYFILESEDCGESLLHRLKRVGKFTEAQVRAVAYQVLQALTYLHKAHMIHRDVKEGNILINADEKVSLCDFGFLRGIDVANSVYTEKVGTYGYQSPEQALNRREYSCQVDVWGLGVVVLNLVLGENRFACKSQSESVARMVEFFGVEKLNSLNLVPAEQQLVLEQGPRRYHLEELLAGRVSEAGADLLLKMLEVSPLRRIEAIKALEHEWFREEGGKGGG